MLTMARYHRSRSRPFRLLNTPDLAIDREDSVSTICLRGQHAFQVQSSL